MTTRTEQVHTNSNVEKLFYIKNLRFDFNYFFCFTYTCVYIYIYFYFWTTVGCIFTDQSFWTLKCLHLRSVCGFFKTLSKCLDSTKLRTLLCSFWIITISGIALLFTVFFSFILNVVTLGSLLISLHLLFVLDFLGLVLESLSSTDSIAFIKQQIVITKETRTNSVSEITFFTSVQLKQEIVFGFSSHPGSKLSFPFTAGSPSALVEYIVSNLGWETQISGLN